MIIRRARAEDLPAVRAIYAHYVEHTVYTFYYDCPSIEHFETLLDTSHCFLIAQDASHILGYAYATRFRQKKAYRWSAEATIYLDHQATGKGLGKRLYGALIDILAQLNYKIILAGLTSPNPASEAFHLSMGFQHIHTLDKIGYKFGQWHSVDWYRKELGPYSQAPEEILELDHIEARLIDSVLHQYSN